jgi:hypothetical protein
MKFSIDITEGMAGLKRTGACVALFLQWNLQLGHLFLVYEG